MENCMIYFTDAFFQVSSGQPSKDLMATTGTKQAVEPLTGLLDAWFCHHGIAIAHVLFVPYELFVSIFHALCF